VEGGLEPQASFKACRELGSYHYILTASERRAQDKPLPPGSERQKCRESWRRDSGVDTVLRAMESCTGAMGPGGSGGTSRVKALGDPG